MPFYLDIKFTFALQILVVYLVSWAFWRIFRAYAIKSPLDNIPGPKSKSFLKGHSVELHGPNSWGFHKELAENYGDVVRIKGPFGENVLYVFDQKALHHIVAKDQYAYEETTPFIVTNRVVFGNGLLATLGEHHRRQRKMLNPVFSTSHMREMVPTFYAVTYKLRDTFLRKVKNGPQEIEVLSWMTRTALELFGQSGLGYSFDQLSEGGKEHPFSASLKLYVPVITKLSLFQNYLLPTLVKIGTPRFQRSVVDILPWKTLHQLRDIVDIAHNTSVEIVESKKQALTEGDEALASKIGRGKDILSILMKENMSASEEDRLAESEVTAQVSTLTFAGMDTTSSVISRLLHLLSEHPEVQNKLRQEIREARKVHGDMSYDELSALPYLDAVCRETLRLHPANIQAFRIARRDVVLPLSTPLRGNDGKQIEEILVPKDTIVIIAILASNRKRETWGPDAAEWKPERWLSPLPDTVANAHVPGVYSHMMTFLGGGRACIGFKFSQLEIKVILSLLLESFRFSPSTSKTVVWRTGILSTPSVGDGALRPQLPLLVSMAE